MSAQYLVYRARNIKRILLFSQFQYDGGKKDGNLWLLLNVWMMAYVVIVVNSGFITSVKGSQKRVRHGVN